MKKVLLGLVALMTLGLSVEASAHSWRHHHGHHHGYGHYVEYDRGPYYRGGYRDVRVVEPVYIESAPRVIYRSDPYYYTPAPAYGTSLTIHTRF